LAASLFLSNSFELKTVIPRRIAPCAPQRPSSRGALRRHCCRGPRRPAARERRGEGIRASFLFDSKRNRRRKAFFFFLSFESRGRGREDENQAAARKRSIISSLAVGLSSTPLWPRLKRKESKKLEKEWQAKKGKKAASERREKVEKLTPFERKVLLFFFFSLNSLSLRRFPFPAICRRLPSGSRLPQGRPCSASTTRRSPRTSSGCFGCVSGSFFR